MSLFLFGDFSSNNYEKECIRKLKLYAENKGVYFWFNEEIDFYGDIEIMIHENSIRFCITSQFQPKNSSDLLLPYDKYDGDRLFPNGDDRSTFNSLCNVNLNIFYDTFLYFITILTPKKLRVFVTVGYDDNFEVKKCSSIQMLDDIKKQVEISFLLDSVIYEIFD